VALIVLKKGKEGNLGQEFIVEAVTGATLTSNGVNDMIQAGLKEHADVIKAFAGEAAPEAEAIPEVEEYEKIETIDKPIEPKVEEMED
jgi:Na+-transporting NADH:ubiquinone oxidoreductase subunit NqrC